MSYIVSVMDESLDNEEIAEVAYVHGEDAEEIIDICPGDVDDDVNDDDAYDDDHEDKDAGW